jgi:molecular chaperone GrpE
LAKKVKKPEVPGQEANSEGLPETNIDETDGSIDPMQELQEELAAAKSQASKNWDLYLREREMIPVLDNLERAVDHAGSGVEDNQGLVEGVNMTINQFRKAIEDFGVKPILAIGAMFDPNLHQAMGHVESTDQAPNTVVTEFQKGYLLHDRLLRPSLVMLAKTPADLEPGPDKEDPATADD